MIDLPDGEISVVGLGASGEAAARWLVEHDYPVYASDLNSGNEEQDAAQRLSGLGADAEAGGHDIDRVRRSALVVTSPGVPPGAPVLAGAAEAGIEVISEIELALRSGVEFKIVAVTGTNGKSTTTALAAHIMQTAGLQAAQAGNIGTPLIQLVERGSKIDWVVLEISSFQLRHTPGLHPDAGVLTNLSADHLDRYRCVEDYFEDKRKLFQNAVESSVWILNADDKRVAAMSDGVAGRKIMWSVERDADACCDRAAGVLKLEGRVLLERDRLALLGVHNVANALAASLVARVAGLSDHQIRSGLESFEALPHRMEVVTAPDGSEWINDSKATNVASTLVALAAMTRPYLWIGGGSSKGEDFTPLAGGLTRCAGVILLGETAATIREVLVDRDDVETVRSLAEAVRAARQSLPAEGVALFSPACPSYDMFRNFEERGEEFRKAVQTP